MGRHVPYIRGDAQSGQPQEASGKQEGEGAVDIQRS